MYISLTHVGPIIYSLSLEHVLDFIKTILLGNKRVGHFILSSAKLQKCCLSFRELLRNVQDMSPKVEVHDFIAHILQNSLNQMSCSLHLTKLRGYRTTAKAAKNFR